MHPATQVLKSQLATTLPASAALQVSTAARHAEEHGLGGGGGARVHPAVHTALSGPMPELSSDEQIAAPGPNARQFPYSATHGAEHGPAGGGGEMDKVQPRVQTLASGPVWVASSCWQPAAPGPKATQLLNSKTHAELHVPSLGVEEEGIVQPATQSPPKTPT